MEASECAPCGWGAIQRLKSMDNIAAVWLKLEVTSTMCPTLLQPPPVGDVYHSWTDRRPRETT